MKLIINAGSIFKGGAEQVVLSFIEECKKFSSHQYHIVLRENISSQLDKDSFPGNFTFYMLDRRPGSGLLSYWKAMRWLSGLEEKIKPDCVISTGGHGYWRPKAPLVSGFNIPHFVYPESPYFEKLDLNGRIRWITKKWVHRFFYRRADAYIVQTDDVNKRLKKYVGKEKVYTVSNTVNGYFFDYKPFPNKLGDREEGEVRLLTLSSYYPHKNIEIIKDVIAELKRRSAENVTFVLTLQSDIFNKIFSEEERCFVKNVGPVPIRECPSLYSECDFMFLPTLLECFSASYAEAMVMRKPVITSDLSFAHTVCGNAAFYVEPRNAADIANKIVRLIGDTEKQSELVTAGIEKLNQFNTPESRAESFLSICREISAR